MPWASCRSLRDAVVLRVETWFSFLQTEHLQRTSHLRSWRERLVWSKTAGTRAFLEEQVPPDLSIPNSPKYLHAVEINPMCLSEGYQCFNPTAERNYLVCGSIHSLPRENRKIYTGFSLFLTLLKLKAVTKSHVSGLQPAGFGKDLLFAFLWGTRFFPAGDMTLEVGQCLDVVHKILFLQMTGWSNWFDYQIWEEIFFYTTW